MFARLRSDIQGILDRDPAARSRLIGTLSALVILWPLFQAAEVQPGVLFDAGRRYFTGSEPSHDDLTLVTIRRLG